MICSSCAAENVAGAKFCNECGAKLASGCPGCGVANPPGARFCNECGTKLDGAAARPAEAGIRTGAETGAAAAHARVAPGDSRAAAATERRLVTVMFADLVGFTTLAAGPRAAGVRAINPSGRGSA